MATKTINGFELAHEGRRWYVMGDTFPIKDRLKKAGCKWDGQRRAWWIGSTKVGAVEALLSSLEAVEDPRLEEDRRNILGTADYKGRAYFYVWHGETRRGEAFRLMFRDGSKTFWASADAVRVRKTFREPVTLEMLQRQDSPAPAPAPKKKEEIRHCRRCDGEFTYRELVAEVGYARASRLWARHHCGC